MTLPPGRRARPVPPEPEELPLFAGLGTGAPAAEPERADASAAAPQAAAEPATGPGGPAGVVLRELPPPGVRSRSFSFVEREGRRWTVFLVTRPDGGRGWRGHFSFRTAAPEGGTLELRTADLFVEDTEAEVDSRARGLGRPLVLALLESALHVHDRRRSISPDVRRWLRDLLIRHSARLVADASAPPAQLSLSHLHSLYESYRADQVAHLIALIEETEFRGLVDRLLEGREIDFRARDRLQLAMIVVRELEQILPLPPFRVWVEDYLSDPDEYHRYSHALHREAELP
jgi:hypothetical protein